MGHLLYFQSLPITAQWFWWRLATSFHFLFVLQLATYSSRSCLFKKARHLIVEIIFPFFVIPIITLCSNNTGWMEEILSVCVGVSGCVCVYHTDFSSRLSSFHAYPNRNILKTNSLLIYKNKMPERPPGIFVIIFPHSTRSHRTWGLLNLSWG